MTIQALLFTVKKLIHPDDYVSERTRSKYENVIDELPIPPKFDEKSSKYRGKDAVTN
jgi:hypothetical protein